MSSKSTTARCLAGFLGFVGCLGLGLITNTVLASDSHSSISQNTGNSLAEPPSIKVFPPTANCLSLVSGALIQNGNEAPDLVAAVGDHGTCGYVKEGDLEGPRFTSPQQALAWQREHKNGVIIDVYDATGVKVIDTFTMVVAEVHQD
jgi:hypothetical protein